MLRAVSTAKGQQLADPVLCITNPYHRFKQANEQHQLKKKRKKKKKEKETEDLGLHFGLVIFSPPFILW